MKPLQSQKFQKLVVENNISEQTVQQPLNPLRTTGNIRKKKQKKEFN